MFTIITKFYLILAIYILKVLCIQTQGQQNSTQILQLQSQNSQEGSLFCLQCQLFLSKIQSKNTTEFVRNIASFTEFFCTTFRIETKKVCKGAIEENAKIVIDMLQKRYTDPNMICPLLGLCPKYYDEINIEDLIKQIEQDKPIVNEYKKEQKNNDKYNILHLTDLHFDEKYKEGASANCKDPNCCREESSESTEKAGYWGYVGNCDIPFRTIEATIEFIKKNLTETLDFIIWTGDNTNHFIWEQSLEDNLKSTEQITQILQQKLPKIKVFPIMGNHESFPVNNYDFGSQREKYFNQRLSSMWQSWIGKEAAEMFANKGFYSTFLNEKVKIIAINTQGANNGNFFLIQNPTDPGKMLEWMREELIDCEKKGFKAIIIGHIPSNGDVLELWSQVYNSIIYRFADVISGQFFGHTHIDQFVVYRNPENKKIKNVAFVAPSLTTFVYRLPTFRVFELFKENAKVVNYIQYSFNITKWNLNGVKDINQVNFDVDYVFKEKYQNIFGNDLGNMDDWEKLLKEMKNNINVFNAYAKSYNNQNQQIEYKEVDQKILCGLEGTQHLQEECMGNRYKKKIIEYIYGNWFTKKN
ncbi:ser thr protein phosphatase family protein, putative [Ichthyophthirius multifiliis]|uniref:Sphingomyelin phosphodiesterase n=1 Tax=Ichthyophthirius multifiliis TaxID=5932 RepID=G0QV69_ICHMU|nr:ser thr protein phosphatase family protein, putative [Ichthyophthirius multifiliis]EGR30882.1 ser thr protein phosphatase family protein, putative [Ichthyophthirius multifiliis]|eukprot:XP_004032469.1 ser thr protein phosphatase family protein, putative [Ichthyophthirius multifiliis]